MTRGKSSYSPIVTEAGDSPSGETYVSPDWEVAVKQWSWSWPLHTYGFACLFFLLAFYSFFSLLNLRTARLYTRPFLSTINLVLCLLGIARASYLFIDPYESKHLMPLALSRAFYETAYPCFTSAFSLILLALLQITKFRAGFGLFHNAKCLAVFIVLHFATILVTSVGSVLHNGVKIAFLVLQTLYILWGLLLSALYIYGGAQMLRLVRHTQRLRLQGHIYNGLRAPKIRITDENEQTYSLNSELSNPSSEDIRRKIVLQPMPENDVGEVEAHVEALNKTRNNSNAFSDSAGDSDVVETCETIENENVEMCVVDRRHPECDGEENMLQMQHNSHGIGDRYRIHQLSSSSLSTRLNKCPLQNVLHMMYVISVLGVILCGLMLYGLYGKFTVSIHPMISNSWLWYIYQTCCRITELGMGCGMAYVTKQPVNKYQFALRAKHNLFSGKKQKSPSKLGTEAVKL